MLKKKLADIEASQAAQNLGEVTISLHLILLLDFCY